MPSGAWAALTTPGSAALPRRWPPPPPSPSPTASPKRRAERGECGANTLESARRRRAPPPGPRRVRLARERGRAPRRRPRRPWRDGTRCRPRGALRRLRATSRAPRRKHTPACTVGLQAARSSARTTPARQGVGRATVSALVTTTRAAQPRGAGCQRVATVGGARARGAGARPAPRGPAQHAACGAGGPFEPALHRGVGGRERAPALWCVLGLPQDPQRAGRQRTGWRCWNCRPV